MTIRIPSSLNWLIKKYQRKEYELKTISKDLAKLLKKKSLLEKELEAIKLVIDLHEIPVTSQDIRSVSFITKPSKSRYGAITKNIYKCLGKISKGESLSNSQIFMFIVKELDLEFTSDSDANDFRVAVSRRLRNLSYEGKITRILKGDNSNEPRYRL